MSGSGKLNALQMWVELLGLGLVVALLSLAAGADGFVIVVEPREEQCVYENAKPGYFISVQFQVLEGGHQDVDIKFTFRSAKDAEDAEERLVLMAQRRTEEKYTFTAEDHGEYKFCFSNLMSLSSSKTLNVATSITMPREHVVEEYLDPLDEVVKQLSSSVDVVKDEQLQMKQRDVITNNLAEATSMQVILYSLVEFVVLFASVGYQIFNIQRMFEVKRVL